MLEGFDHYHIQSTSASRMALKGWFGGAFVGEPGRLPYGSQSQAVEVIEFNPIHKALPAPTSDLVVGFAFQIQKYHSINLLTLHDQDGSNSASLGVSNLGFMTVTDGGTVITGTHQLRPDTWYYAEMKLDSGTAEVHLNGIVDIPAVGGDYSNDWYIVSLETGGVFSPRVQFDDFYMCDLDGSVNNDFLGDICVETLYPISDGTYRDWTPDTGTDHFSRVNEHQIDELLSYVSTAGAGNKDTYNMGDPVIDPLTPVLGVQLNLGLTKLEPGVRTMKPLIRQAGTDYEGDTTYVTADWGFVSWLLDEDPSGAPWDAATVMADEYGIDLVT